MKWIDVAAFDELAEGSVRGIDVAGTPVALVRREGRIHALHNICTHQFAFLSEGALDGEALECPLHQGRFCLRSGRPLGGPVERGVATYATKVEGGRVLISLEAPAEEPASAGTATRGEAETLVVVGGGQAGGEAIKAARGAGFAGRIVLVAEEPHLPYERPPLSKEILKGQRGPEAAALLDAAAAETLGLEVRLGCRAMSLDREARRLALSDGESLAYDRLLLATGARLRRLEIPGAELEGVLYLRSLDEAQALRARLAEARHLVVVGGGFIGLEVASAAREAGLAVTVLEREAALLARVLPAPAAALVAERAREAGVTLRTAAAVEAFIGESRVEAVALAGGERIEADLVVVGVGVQPNLELARDAGLAVEDGILVDAAGRSSDPRIFAAGDVAVFPQPLRGRRRRLESWQHAREQGRAAGTALAGGEARYDRLPWFWSDLFGGGLQMLGLPLPGDEAVVRDAAPAGKLVFCLEQGRLTGAVALDAGRPLRRLKSAIARGARADAEALADQGRPLEEILGSLEAGGALLAPPRPPQTSEGTGETAMRNGSRQAPPAASYEWPEEGLTRIPDWVYTDEGIYRREVERIFHGRTWNYVALEAELPEAGSFVRSYVGPTPVVVARAEDGSINVFENRCAHRAAEFCRHLRGKTKEFVCPYHQWSYDLKGNLVGVPFRRGVNQRGGMPADFDPAAHGLRRLSVTTRRGVVFASYRDDMEPLEDYFGPEILREFDSTFDGRKLTILGYYRNTLPGNWKLYHENLKDPYHATLLHTFLVTFGLLVAGNRSAMLCDDSGRHGVMASAKSDGKAVSAENAKEMRAYREGMELQEPRFMDFVEEFDSPWSVTMQTIWPNLIVQREMNTLGVRQIVPEGPNQFTMIWTMFGFEGDSEEMTRHRLRQGNLMGPAGFLGLEDNEAMKFVQDGMLSGTTGRHLVALDPDTPAGTADTLISESAIRAMYQHWRGVIGV